MIWFELLVAPLGFLNDAVFVDGAAREKASVIALGEKTMWCLGNETQHG
jgi:hypothetical protein